MGAITIRPYRNADHQAFRQINLDWIEPLFGAEEKDHQTLDDPQTHVLDKRGRILMAELDGLTIGTVALIPTGEPGTVELAKMGVAETARGTGAGRALMTAAIESARDMGAKKVWLESNRTLDAALALYRSAGFSEISEADRTDTPYTRCDIQMQLFL